RVLASTAVTVTPVEVTLEAPREVAAGAVFNVAWTGPNGGGDYVTIVPVGAAEGTALSVGFTVWGSTLELTAPEQGGDYEIRYFAGNARRTLASVPITVE